MVYRKFYDWENNYRIFVHNLSWMHPDFENFSGEIGQIREIFMLLSNEVQDLQDFLGDRKKAEIVRKIHTLEENRAIVADLLTNNDTYRKTYTQEEKQYKRLLIEQLDQEIVELKTSIGMKAKKEASLFGIDDDFPKTISGKGLVRILQKNDWQPVRQTGSHIQVKNPSGGTVSIPNHKELHIGTYKTIQRQINNLGQL